MIMGKLSNIRPTLGSLPPRLKLPPKIADQFYQSREWRALVAEVRRERGAWCERCGSAKGLIADHIVEIKDGGAKLHKSNVELLCGRHHARKTADARKRRAQGAA